MTPSLVAPWLNYIWCSCTEVRWTWWWYVWKVWLVEAWRVSALTAAVFTMLTFYSLQWRSFATRSNCSCCNRDLRRNVERPAPQLLSGNECIDFRSGRWSSSITSNRGIIRCTSNPFLPYDHSTWFRCKGIVSSSECNPASITSFSCSTTLGNLCMHSIVVPKAGGIASREIFIVLEIRWEV